MVNLATAERQALGAHFTVHRHEARLREELLAGKLTMSPHRAWTLPKDPTWTEDPFSDNNWQFQYHMLRWLDPLRRAGQSGDTSAAETWEHYARSWIAANPPGDSRSRWAWIDMTDGIRALELCHGLCVVGEQDWLIRSIEQHRDWLADPAHIKAGNHGLHQTVGLFVTSAVLEDRTAMDLAVTRLGERLRLAWDAQGVNEEGSLAYHRMNHNWWQDTMARLDLEGVARPEGAERLDLAPVEMAHATSPLGRLARIGDTNGASISDVDHPYAQYVTSNGARGSHPEETTAVYERGYAYVRSGWGEDRPFSEETYLTAVFGAQDKVHGHRDGGSITYCSQGTQWLHDQGRFYYGKDPMQRYVVSRESHSLIVLPGRTPRSSADVSLVRQDETDACVDLLFSDPSYDDVQITRRVIYLKHWDLTVVLDHVESEAAVQIEQRWHCGAGVSATALSLGFSLEHEDRAFHVAALTSNGRRDVRRGQKDPLVGWTATGWRRSAPVDVATVHDEGSDIVVGALLGTWSPAAVDLLRARLQEVDDLTGALTDIVPAALLRTPWAGARSAAPAATGQPLSARALVIGPETLKVIADGPGRYFGFDLYDGGQLVQRGPWLTRREQSFELTGVGTPRLRVRNRSTPEDLQATVLEADAWQLPLPRHVPAAEAPLPNADPAPVSSLILIETMFCDFEQDPAVLDTYFQRFRLCLRGLQRLEVPTAAQILVTLYMSSDKVEHLEQTRQLLDGTALPDGLRIRIHEYAHPAEGYPGDDRIDWVKSPNKHAPFRDRLFAEAHQDVAFGEFERLIRMAVDDDDILLPHQPQNMLTMASAAEAEAPETEVIVLGPLRTYVAYVDGGCADLEEVDMRRSLTGNKAFLIRNPGRTDIRELSPWSVPELMTAVQARTIRLRGQRLLPVHDNEPGFIYMRWGQNLSAHRKDFHIERTHGRRRIDRLEELLELGPSGEAGKLSFDLVPLDLRITARRVGAQVVVNSNLDRLRAPSAHLCLQVFRAGRRIASTPYSRKSSARFDDVPEGATVRGFLRFEGEIVGRSQAVIS